MLLLLRPKATTMADLPPDISATVRTLAPTARAVALAPTARLTRRTGP